MIKTIKMYSELTPDKYEVQVGDRIRVHNRDTNISHEITDALVNYDVDEIFEVISKEAHYYQVKSTSTGDTIRALFIQRSLSSTSSFKFNTNYALVIDDNATLKLFI